MYVHDSKLDERNREIALFLSQAEQKGIRIFSCSFYFTTDVCCGFQIARKEKRNFTLFLSQAEQKGKGIFHVHFTLQHTYVQDSKLDEKNREIALFLSQAEQKGKRNFLC